MTHSTDKLKKGINNALFNWELLMKDKDKKWKILILEKKKDHKKSTIKW